MREVKCENIELKDRMTELCRQMDIYKNEVCDFERQKLHDMESQLRHENETLKHEKERLCDRQAEMALALKDATEEIRRL